MNPMQLFSRWFNEALQDKRLQEPSAATLATVSGETRPSARIVLIKEIDALSVVFYTNYDSRKAAELKTTPYAALCCYWMPQNRQVRLEGRVKRTSLQESAAYFATRPRESQLGAWASQQSRPCSRGELLRRYREYEKHFAGSEVPCPEFWGGFRLQVEAIEFWQAGEFRLHHRLRCTRSEGGKWRGQGLCP
jgi:pyridoxamine 5'-phosphate oxidase